MLKQTLLHMKNFKTRSQFAPRITRVQFVVSENLNLSNQEPDEISEPKSSASWVKPGPGTGLHSAQACGRSPAGWTEKRRYNMWY